MGHAGFRTSHIDEITFSDLYREFVYFKGIDGPETI